MSDNCDWMASRRRLPTNVDRKNVLQQMHKEDKPKLKSEFPQDYLELMKKLKEENLAAIAKRMKELENG